MTDAPARADLGLEEALATVRRWEQGVLRSCAELRERIAVARLSSASLISRDAVLRLLLDTEALEVHCKLAIEVTAALAGELAALRREVPELFITTEESA